MIIWVMSQIIEKNMSLNTEIIFSAQDMADSKLPALAHLSMLSLSGVKLVILLGKECLHYLNRIHFLLMLSLSSNFVNLNFGIKLSQKFCVSFFSFKNIFFIINESIIGI